VGDDGFHFLVLRGIAVADTGIRIEIVAEIINIVAAAGIVAVVAVGEIVDIAVVEIVILICSGIMAAHATRGFHQVDPNIAEILPEFVNCRQAFA
jgi:hypothetical protein